MDNKRKQFLFWKFIYSSVHWGSTPPLGKLHAIIGFIRMTIREIISEIDRGNVAFRTAPQIITIDGIHENACRNVLSFSNLFVDQIMNLHIKKVTTVCPTTTRIILSLIMETLNHLRIVYREFECKMNYYVLNNNINHVKPKLIKVLK